MIVECPGCASRYDVTGRPPGTQARCRCGRTFALPAPKQQAGQLGCPQCGANVPSTDHICTFCTAALKIKACPRCFAQIFHNSKHCDHCGARVERPAEATSDGTARTRRCPRCQGGTTQTDPELEARLVADVLLDECPGCSGVFLDVYAVERVVRERRQASANAIIGMVDSAPRESIGAMPDGRVYLKCPDCDQVMNRVNFGRRSGIIVDVCRPHGTWFDQDELPRIVAFVMKGGLEESERRDIDQLKEEARRARSEARSSAQMAAVGGSWGGGRSTSSFMFGSMLGSIGRILIE